MVGSSEFCDGIEPVLRVPVRSYAKWFAPVAFTAIFVGGVISRGGLSMNGRGLAWVVTVALTNINLVLVALRTSRGLTLDADGITWHGAEAFLPWPKVEKLEVVAFDDKYRLVVKSSSQEVPVGQRGLAKVSLRANEQKFGGPVAIPVAELTVPVDQIITTAEQCKKDYVAAGRTIEPDGPAALRRQRALRTMNMWSALGFGGLLVGLAITFLR
jgi:hypothetical protein